MGSTTVAGEYLPTGRQREMRRRQIQLGAMDCSEVCRGVSSAAKDGLLRCVVCGYERSVEMCVVCSYGWSVTMRGLQI